MEMSLSAAVWLRVVILILLIAQPASASDLWSITAEPEYGSQTTGTAPLSRAGGGVAYDLIEQHHRYDDSPEDFVAYTRYQYTIVNSSGLDNSGSISIDFDPAFQKVELHKVLIHRGNEAHNHLIKERVQLLQTERELDVNLYHGTRTVHLLLDDLRVSDKIEISYSILGRNPVFENKIFGWNTLQYSMPVGTSFFRLSYPETKNIHTRRYAGHGQHTTNHNDSYEIKTWRYSNIEGMKYQSNVPYNQVFNTTLQYSEFNDWSEVAEWARPIYQIEQSADETIVQKAAQIKAAYPTLKEQVSAAVLFVQDDIRYTGVQTGIGGWVPDRGADILRRRYGDCKDKTMLLALILEQLGVQSYPVLAHTEQGKAIPGYLPTPDTFNHMILHVPGLEGSSYWIDPTISLQGASIDTLYQPDYHHALIPARPELGLKGFEQTGPSQPEKVVDEYYKLRDNYMAKPTSLIITTTLVGREAEYFRRSLQSSSRQGYEDNYLDFYQKRYADISLAKPLTINDDRQANQITVVENYLIDNIWSEEAVANKTGEDPPESMLYELYVYADAVSEILSLPKDRKRHQPLAQPHPVYARHTIRLFDLDGWDFESGEYAINNDYFDYTETTSVSDYEIQIDYTIKTKTDEVTVADSKRYLRDLKKFLDSSYFYTQFRMPLDLMPENPLERQVFSIVDWLEESLHRFSNDQEEQQLVDVGSEE